MEGRSHHRQDTTTGARRRARLLSWGVLTVTAASLLVACGPEGEKPYSTTTPASTQADDIHGLYKLIFWLSLIVFVGVQFAVVYLSLRYRRKKSDTKRPPQIHGNKRLELVWTIIPALVLLVLLVPTVSMLYDHDAQAQNGDLQVDVFGKQWWWEFHMNEDNAQGGENLQVVTANEIYIPVDTNVVFNLQSNNVIHSFWIPQLSGKLDLIPGHVNKLAINATMPGTYYGECAEFCGAQHAWMRFTIHVVPQDQFYNWVNNWRTSPNPAAMASTGSEGVVQAPAKFSVCLACHRVNGMEGGQNALSGINAPANMGPDLTMLACRETIAAGMLEMTPENLRLWLQDPGKVKPGNYMATQIGPGHIELTDQELDEFVNFIYSMSPSDCTAPNGWDTTAGETSPAASPVATPVSSPATDGN